MYRLLIVDDEETIRNGIAKGNPWHEWGFEVVGSAADGLQALSCIEQTNPDVILSDIRMPDMDGIELMQYVNKNHPHIKMIILSGYSDFEYLNMAIKNNVAEYLLKPTDIDQFEELFRRMKDRLDEEVTERKYIEKSRIAQIDSILNTMIKGYDDSILSSDINMLNSFSIYPSDCVAVIIDTVLPQNGYDSKVIYTIRRNVLEYANKFECDGIKAHFFFTPNDKIAGIMSGSYTDNADNIDRWFNTLSSQIENEYGTEILVSISGKSTDNLMLPQCFAQALTLAHTRIFEPGEHTAFYKTLAESESSRPTFIFDYDTVWRNLINNRSEEVYNEINRVFGLFETEIGTDYKYVEQVCSDFLFYLAHRSHGMNISFEQIMYNAGVRYEDIHNTLNLSHRKKIIIDCISSFSECITQTIQHKSKSSQLAQTIKELCDNEYAENYISLEYIADKVKKSVAHISKLFKDEFGMKFSEYIITKRLEKSCEYLADTTLKIYEIAEKIGYVDVSNYIKLFKKRYGISPGDYRSFIQNH